MVRIYLAFIMAALVICHADILTELQKSKYSNFNISSNHNHILNKFKLNTNSNIEIYLICKAACYNLKWCIKKYQF